MKVNISQWIKHTMNELLTFDYLKEISLSVDKFTELSLHPNELISTIDIVGNDYRWIYFVMKGKMISEEMDEKIDVLY